MKTSKYIIAALLSLAVASAACGCTSSVTVVPSGTENGTENGITEIQTEENTEAATVDEAETESENTSAETETGNGVEDNGKTSESEEQTENQDADLYENTDIIAVSETYEDEDGNLYFMKLSAENFDEGGIFFNIPFIDGTRLSIVRLDKKGNETEILETGSFAPFAVCNKSIFYNDNSGIFRADISGKNPEKLTDGNLAAVSEDGNYIIYTGNYGNEIYSYSVKDDSTITIEEDGSFLAVYDGYIYYSISDYSKDAQKGKVILARAAADGSCNELLCITEPDVYSEEMSMGATCADIVAIHFDDEYIYFSYGSTAGSGAFYQYGNISKVKYDGSGYEKIMGETDDGVAGEFYVKNGKVYTVDEAAGAYYSSLIEYYQSENSVIYFTKPSGKPESIIDTSEYTTDCEMSVCDYVSVTDNYVCFMYQEGNYSEENSIGWRDYYSRERSTYYIIDRDSGEEIYSYSF